jgi:hypothetical protein
MEVLRKLGQWYLSCEADVPVKTCCSLVTVHWETGRIANDRDARRRPLSGVLINAAMGAVELSPCQGLGYLFPLAPARQ